MSHIEDPKHLHQDPRALGRKGKVDPAKAHLDVRHQNQGALKARAPGRMDRVVNWFRRGRGR